MRPFSRVRIVRGMKSQLDLFLGLKAAAFAQGAAELPKRLKVLAWGDNATASGRPVRVGAKTLQTLSVNQKRFGFDEVALDFEHNTVPNTKAFKEAKEPRPVAAYGAVEAVENDGLFFNVSRWTPEGEKSALNYQDLSPAIHQDENGEVLFVHSVGLCRQGDVEGLHFVPFSVETGAMDYKAKLIEMLELSEGATDADIQAALDSLEAAPDEMAAMTSQVAELTGRIATLSADLEAVKGESDSRRRQEICERAAREGKVIPLTAEEIAATSVATLSAMVEKLEATVPLNRQTPAGDPPPSSASSTAVIEQYNAISDPEERARFFNAHREKILGR